ncbi:cell division protein FtsL [Suttonella sp. R2A3]|uniref:cell division protein FtsL n=1 Tax=Suttonella sp. R2A3 TaxID=2908648 RepID=UPI001F2D28D3|nr:cell division protein FtsL [Suttonella sp. R2A3]UJF24607.1 cell division protein FtsL [Suttonella sp. R2A3]
MKMVLVSAFALLLAATGYNAVLSTSASQQQGELVNQVQTLKKARNEINTQWTQLLIEQKMLADDSMVSHAVRTRMDMHLPGATQVVYLD